MTEPNPTETPAEHPPAARSPRADVFIAYPGPDADLTRGLHDALSRQGLAVFGEVRIPEFLPSLFRNGSPSRAPEPEEAQRSLSVRAGGEPRWACLATALQGNRCRNLDLRGPV